MAEFLPQFPDQLWGPPWVENLRPHHPSNCLLHFQACSHQTIWLLLVCGVPLLITTYWLLVYTMLQLPFENLWVRKMFCNHQNTGQKILILFHTIGYWYYYLPKLHLGSEVKSRRGMGIFLTTYSEITSMLYLSWADMGMIGAFSAMVPLTKSTISLCCSIAWENISIINTEKFPPSRLQHFYQIGQIFSTYCDCKRNREKLAVSAI